MIKVKKHITLKKNLFISLNRDTVYYSQNNTVMNIAKHMVALYIQVFWNWMQPCAATVTQDINMT